MSLQFYLTDFQKVTWQTNIAKSLINFSLSLSLNLIKPYIVNFPK